jgi:PIN domain nuclease of toxin-antitoxin system
LSTVLVDTHVLHWLSAEPDRLSPRAEETIRGATEIAVSDISWFELALLAERGRLIVSTSIRGWLHGLAREVRTVPIAPDIAATAIALPDTFPRDPADRLIYATAIERGWQLVTKDDRLRGQREPDPAVW